MCAFYIYFYIYYCIVFTIDLLLILLVFSFRCRSFLLILYLSSLLPLLFFSAVLYFHLSILFKFIVCSPRPISLICSSLTHLFFFFFFFGLLCGLTSLFDLQIVIPLAISGISPHSSPSSSAVLLSKHSLLDNRVSLLTLSACLPLECKLFD